MAKSSGQEFSIIDSALVAEACAASIIHSPQKPGVVAAFYQSGAFNEMKAMWSIALSRSSTSKYLRFKNASWDKMPVPKLVKEAHFDLEKVDYEQLYWLEVWTNWFRKQGGSKSV
ncbi:hypothetical protein [uncultured Ruegeria sp.]|uniref:hypothetical protein n=1 Tax=uncultured Ruegeria sp. TaxID=259304 RepID=UPI0026311E3D|nr:hypothetical protein [uncultured Ruegeria sp.]